MNGYPKEIFNNHVKKFLSEKLMTTNSCQNMNDEKKYTVIIPFIGHPSITLKKSLTKDLKSINKKCTLFKTFKVHNYFSLKDETPLALQANVTDMLHKKPSHTCNTCSSSCTMPLLNRPAHSKTTFGDWSFSFASSSVWNSISNDVRCAPSLSSFKSGLKTYFFDQFTKTELYP